MTRRVERKAAALDDLVEDDDELRTWEDTQAQPVRRRARSRRKPEVKLDKLMVEVSRRTRKADE